MNARIEAPTEFRTAVSLESAGINVLRYALLLIFVIFGSLKFTAAEAAAI